MVVRLPDGVRPLRYALHLALDPAKDRFEGAGTIEVELTTPARVVWLHGRDLRVSACDVEGEGARLAARYEQVSDEGVARITFPRVVGPGRFTLRLAWDAPFGDAAAAGLHRWRAGSDVYVLPELGGNGAGRVFPAFADPRFKTPFEVSVTVPAALLAVANEPAVAETALPGGLKRVRFATTRPLPTYPLFVSVGPFDVVERSLPPSAVRSGTLPVRGLAPRDRGRELSAALDAAGALVGELERWLAMPFPYRKLDHVAAGDFPGAFEDAGAILYGAEEILQDPARPDEARRRTAAWIIAHELAHQWFGDLVTMPSHTDVWLNESIASLVGYEVADRAQPGWGVAADHVERVERIMRADSLPGARVVRRPVRNADDLADQIDGFVFDKGSAVLETFARWMGTERFRDALRVHLAAHADGIATVEDLTGALSAAAGREVGPALLGFLERPGLPLVEARVTCQGGAARAHLAQRRYRPRGSELPAAAWQVPVCARFGDGDATGERCALVPPEGADLELPGCPTWFLPDAGGTAYYRWVLAPADPASLLRRAGGHLTALERLSVARNARAAQRAGALGYAAAMDALAALATDPEPAVERVAMEAIRDARDHLLAPDDRPLAEAMARRLFRPALEGNGFDTPPGESDLARRRRVEFVRFLVEVGRDPRLRREAARRGVAYAGAADGRFHPEGLPPELAVTALRAALEEHGPELYDALLPRLADAAGTDRDHLVEALATASAPSLGGRPAGLWRDARLRPMERLFPALIDHDAGVMRRTYAQLRTDLDRMAAAVPSAFDGFLPLAARELCNEADLVEARRTLERAVARHPSMRGNAERALEQAKVCATERAAERVSAAAWFRGATPKER
jgi:alanyl aminopeptidase